MVERVGELDASNKVLLLLIDRHALIFHLGRRVLPFVMVAVLERSEWRCEVLDVATLLALAACHPNFNDVVTLV